MRHGLRFSSVRVGETRLPCQGVIDTEQIKSPPGPLYAYIEYIFVGLASVSDGAVNHSHHCVSKTTRESCLVVVLATTKAYGLG